MIDRVNPASERTPTTARPRLDFLDGLRGLAALYVVLHHAAQELHYQDIRAVPPQKVFTLLKFLDFGHYAVDVFIVLSGFCLMLPIARSASGHLRGGFGEYIKRRAKRILPPYYAALLLSLPCLLLAHALRVSLGAADANYRWELAPAVLASHLLVLHNLLPSHATAINPPLWSVATEWQIYFVFPLFLLPLWRRFGNVAAVVAGFALGLAPHYLLHGLFDSACFWFIGLFALGMAGAAICFSSEARMATLRQRVPWAALSTLLWLGLALFGVARGGWYNAHRWLADPIFGLATICLIVACTSRAQSSARSLTLRLFSHRFAVGLGAFSYSLYLVHFPLLRVGHLALIALGIPALWRVPLLFFGAVPAIIALSYGFHLTFERRFMPGHPHTLKKAEIAAALSPAP